MFLKKNDTIGIVATSGFIKDYESVKTAILLLKKWGFNVKLATHLYAKHYHFAGTDNQRTSDFQHFLDDETIKAIWCVRGGYGAVRIIENLDFNQFKKHPKWIIGYSDITVLHHVVFSLGFQSLHSFMPTSTESLTNKKVIANFKNLLDGKNLHYKIPSHKQNKTGSVKGKIIGGNLSLITSLLGTKYALKAKNYILFIEEIGEYKYEIDRMLYSLKLNNYFKNCVGLIVGDFTKIKINDPKFGQTIPQIILNIVAEYDFPVCFDFPAGHIKNNNPILFGKEVSLSVTKTITLLNF